MSYGSLRTEKATYWGPGALNGFGGVKGFDTPITLLVRWQDEKEKKVTTDGKEFLSNAVIYCDRELNKNGWLYRGESVAASPPAGAYKIELTQRSQNPSGSIVIHKAVL